MSLSVSVSGADRRLRFDWPAASKAWSAQVTPLAGQLLRASTPVGAGPTAGRMRQSVTPREEMSAAALMVVFYTTVPYAGYVLGGTKAHPIAARNAKALRWLDNRGHGPVRFARSVQHPGTKANPFPEKALGTQGALFARMFADAAREAVISD